MIDTAEKRAAALNFATIVSPLILPIPDGSIDNADRAQLCWCYVVTPETTPPIVVISDNIALVQEEIRCYLVETEARCSTIEIELRCSAVEDESRCSIVENEPKFYLAEGVTV